MSIFKKLFGSKEEKPQVQEQPGVYGEMIVAFQQMLKQPIEWKTLKTVEYAMWLPCEEDKSSLHSPIIEKWSEVYELTKNNWSYITGDLLKTLKLLKDDTFRLSLPDNFQAFAFLASNDEQVILSLSQEKGIRFHFPSTMLLKNRLTFLETFICYCQAWNEMIQQNKGDQDQDIGCSNWWEATLKTVKTVEETKEPVLSIGKIAI